MIISLAITNFIYCGSSIALNLMQPFDQIDLEASFPTAFEHIKYMHAIVSFGPLFTILGSLISSVYSITRILYSMSKDGLLFQFLSLVSEKTRTPYMATIVSGLICILLILIIDFKDLVHFTNISEFFVFSMVALALLVVRYCNIDIDGFSKIPQASIVPGSLAGPNGIEKINLFENKKYSLCVILYIYISNILLIGLLNNFDEYATEITIVFIMNTLVFTIFLTFFKQYKSDEISTFNVGYFCLIVKLAFFNNEYFDQRSQWCPLYLCL